MGGRDEEEGEEEEEEEEEGGKEVDREDDGGEVVTASLAVRTRTGVGTCRGSEEIGVDEEGDGRELIVSSVVFSSGLSLNALAMASSLKTG